MQKKSLIATAAIFCCRFTGLLREIVYTSLFGATGALDAFLTAFRVPNMLRDMFAEGALSQSFTSTMSKVEKQQGADAAWGLAHRVSSQLVSLMICIVSIGILLAGTFMQQLYPERARVVVHTPWGAPTMLCADAAFRGFRTTIDGTKEALFTSNEKIQGLTEESCILVSRLENLAHGQTLVLTTAPAGEAPAGATRLEARSFMGLATDLCRIIWPFILMASVSALCMGALNVFGVFGLPNLASAAFNLTTVAVGALIGWFIDPAFGPEALYGFAIAVVCGGAAQVLVQYPKLRSLGFRPRWDVGLKWNGRWFAFTDEPTRRVWLLMLPGVIAAGITQTNIFINTAFALYLKPGSVTALSSAFHLWQLPVALFGVAVGMVVLPTVSRMTLTGGNAGTEISEHLAKALRFMCLFAVPAAIFLSVWGEQIVSVFYQRGRFDAEAARFTGDVLAAYSLGLLAYAGMKVLQPVFLALEKPWAPAGLALVAFCISVGCNYTFVHVFHLQAMYLALTTSIVTTLNFVFYFLYIRHLLGGMACHILLPGVLRIVGAGVVLAACCWAVGYFFFADFTSWGFLARFGALAVAGVLGAAVYGVACMAFRVPELQMFTARLRKR